MTAASTEDPVGYVAPWHPVGSMPGWVYAPSVAGDTWGRARWCALPVASVRVGIHRTPRRLRYSVQHVIPGWLAMGWAEILGGRPLVVRRVDMRRLARLQGHLEAIAAVAGRDVRCTALLDATRASA